MFPGRDVAIRTVEIKTMKGILTRLIQRLHELEVGDGGREPTTELNVEETQCSHYGRRIKTHASRCVR